MRAVGVRPLSPFLRTVAGGLLLGAALVLGGVALFLQRGHPVPTGPRSVRGEPRPARVEAVRRARALAEARGGQWDRVADTGSMEPVLTGGDLAVVVPVDIREIRVGDVIVFLAARATDPDEAPPRHVVHRVVARGLCGGGLHLPRLSTTAECVLLRTRGDANAAPDGRVTSWLNFVGRVQYRVHGQTGEVADLVRSRAGQPVPFETALAEARRQGPAGVGDRDGGRPAG